MKFPIKRIGWITTFSLLGCVLLILATLNANLKKAHAKQSVALGKTVVTLNGYKQRFSPAHPHAVFKIHNAANSRVTTIPHFVHNFSEQRYYCRNSRSHLQGGGTTEFGILIRYFPSNRDPSHGAAGNLYEVIWSEGKRVDAFAKMTDYPDSSRIVKTGAGVQKVGETKHYTIELVDDGRKR